MNFARKNETKEIKNLICEYISESNINEFKIL